MGRTSKLTDARLDSLYTASDFGGASTMRARVIRELIDEIRALRGELTQSRSAARVDVEEPEAE